MKYGFLWLAGAVLLVGLSPLACAQTPAPSHEKVFTGDDPIPLIERFGKDGKPGLGGGRGGSRFGCSRSGWGRTGRGP
jgi:hypothetical protein